MPTDLQKKDEDDVATPEDLKDIQLAREEYAKGEYVDFNDDNEVRQARNNEYLSKLHRSYEQARTHELIE